MLSHRSAVLLLGGWLLMSPPLVPDQFEPDTTQPISAWTGKDSRAYGTVAACEYGKRARIEDTRRRVKRGIDDYKRDAPEARPEVVWAIPYVQLDLRGLWSDELARCVPAERVRRPVK